MVTTVHGYVTHAAANRRRFIKLFAGYLLGFELVGAAALTMILLIVDRDHTLLTDPAGYALRYALPVAALAALVFWRIHRGHADYVADALEVRLVTRGEEPRFVALAEEQCTALGVRLPRFGIIEVPELNALTVGEGPTSGLIAVTRGLLERLDDDELAAVLAHEASHIRNGDTKVLAANHALKRTAVLFQTHNVLRVEDWRQMWLPLVIPPILPLMLAGGAATALSMRYARWAQRGVRLSRDAIADGEAVRVTHFPEALISALAKVAGRGCFAHSHRVDALLFDGLADYEGGSHPAVAERMQAIADLGRDLMDPARGRRDTRGPRGGRRPAEPVRAAFGMRDVPRSRRAPERAPAGRFHFAYDAAGKPLEEPPTPTAEMLWLWLADRPAYKRWSRGLTAWHEWREADRRDVFGVAPHMVLPLLATIVLIMVFHWPADNDPLAFLRIFDPAGAVNWGAELYSMFQGGGVVAPLPDPMSDAAVGAEAGPDGEWALMIVPLMMMLFVGCAVVSPKTLLWLFKVKKEQR